MISSEFLPGVYERVQSGLLQKFLRENPELRAIFEKIDHEEEPAKYSAFVARLVEAALHQKSTTEERLTLCNDLLEKIFSNSEMEHARGDLLPISGPQLLTEITPAYLTRPGLPRRALLVREPASCRA